MSAGQSGTWDLEDVEEQIRERQKLKHKFELELAGARQVLEATMDKIERNDAALLALYIRQSELSRT